MSAAHTETRSAPLYWLALGAFAIGTEGFMVAAILPKIASDLSVSVVAAGQIITLFALSYGLSSPILTALTGRVGRRTLLIASMAAFAVANLLAAAAPNYSALMAARVLLAFTAGLFVPGANALAGALVAPERRGRALAIVNSGLSIAVTLGVPLGAVVGNTLGWRMTFIGVAILAGLALIGLIFGLPRDVGASLTTASLRERLDVAVKPGIPSSLLVTLLWAVGAYTVYTYIAPFMARAVGIEGGDIGAVLFLWGASAALGLVLSGLATDRFGSRRITAAALVAAAIALSSLSNWAHLLSPRAALVPVGITVAVWGMAHWSFWPAQQARLIGLAGLKSASVALSLNASAMYLGFSLGATLGSLVMRSFSVADLGWAGGASVVLSLAVYLTVAARSAPPARQPSVPPATP